MEVRAAGFLNLKSLSEFTWAFFIWCLGGESNSHGLPHTILSRARIPIPPPRLIPVF